MKNAAYKTNCPYCNQRMEVPSSCWEQMMACPGCGKEMYMPSMQDSASSDEQVDIDHMTELFVGKRYDYYYDCWMESLPTFNGAAFFAGPFWAVYRKMFALGIVSYFISIFLFGIGVYGFENSFAPANLILIWFVLSIFWGFTGNFFYKQHVKIKIKSVLSESPPDEIHNALRRAGGTSLFSAEILLFFPCIVLFCLSYSFIGIVLIVIVVLLIMKLWFDVKEKL